MNSFEIMVLATLLFSLCSMLYIGYWFGENAENKRICSAWYEDLNLTTYKGLVFDNGTVVNFSMTSIKKP